MSALNYAATEVTVGSSGDVSIKTADGQVNIPAAGLVIVTNGVPNKASNLPGWFAAAMDAHREMAKDAGSPDVKPIRVEVSTTDSGTRVTFNQ